MRKVLLDVGAHVGQTLTAALRWNFDRIVCFEPAAANCEHLREIADKRTCVEPIGLWNETAAKQLYDTGSQGASLWKRPKRSTESERCLFVRASDWFGANLKPDDQVWMKLNAEGAEIDILTDLLDSGMFERVNYLLVMWDAHKIPAVAPRLAAMKARMSQFGSPRVVSSKEVEPAVSHIGRIDQWLKMTAGISRL